MITAVLVGSYTDEEEGKGEHRDWGAGDCWNFLACKITVLRLGG